MRRVFLGFDHEKRISRRWDVNIGQSFMYAENLRDDARAEEDEAEKYVRDWLCLSRTSKSGSMFQLLTNATS